jgi:hypothetical protein
MAAIEHDMNRKELRVAIADAEESPGATTVTSITDSGSQLDAFKTNTCHVLILIAHLIFTNKTMTIK